MQIQALIVDDEPPARDLLRKYISMVDQLYLIEECHSAVHAFEVLKKEKIDLIFLDIQMPVLTGLDFIKALQNPPKIILTTAYRDYAVEGYDLDIIDYLLKPISFDRFLKAVNRYKDRIATNSIDTSIKDDNAYIFVNINKTRHKILLEKILLIESLKDYVRIHTTDSSLVVKGNIGSMEKQLPESLFLRIHRSYIVPVDKIQSYNSSSIKIGDQEYPIGGSYKKRVMERIKE